MDQETNFKGKPFSYYEGLDKRKKEYKEYKAYKKLIEGKSSNEKIEVKEELGAGDVVEKITEATGIKKVVKKLFGEDCGCEGRKKRMNEYKGLRFFNKRQGNPLTAEEFEFLVGDYFNKEVELSRDANRRMQKIYNRVFNYSPRTKFKTCGSCVKRMEENLQMVVDYYLNNEL